MRKPEEYVELAERALDSTSPIAVSLAAVYASLAVAASIREASSSWRDLSLPPSRETEDR